MPGATAVLVAVVIAFGAVVVAIGMAFAAAFGAAVLSPPFEPFCPKRGDANASLGNPVAEPIPHGVRRGKRAFGPPASVPASAMFASRPFVGFPARGDQIRPRQPKRFSD